MTATQDQTQATLGPTLGQSEFERAEEHTAHNLSLIHISEPTRPY